MLDLITLENIMQTERGRRFIAEILSLCGVGTYSHTGDMLRDAFYNGRRSVGEEILLRIRMIQSAHEADDGLSLEYKMAREKMRRSEEDLNE